MAAPIQLKSMKAGGNSFKKSVKAQKPNKGKAAPAPSPKVRVDKGKKIGGAGVKTAYQSSKAVNRPKVAGVSKSQVDYTSAWMESHGLKFAQNANKARLPYATIPADGIGTGTGLLKRKKGGSPSSATTKPRVKTTYTGKSFKVTKRPKVLKSK